MKALRNFFASATTGLLLTGLALSFNACTEGAPLQTGADTVSTKRASGELKILKANTFSLLKAFVTEKLITVKKGGKVEVGDDVHGYSSLHFNKRDVSQDVWVRFNWESTGLLQGGAEFSPHGTTFNNPVQIRLSYKDADLAGLNEQDIRIWYFNEINGIWELIASEVDTDKKQVEGYLNHFSQYALAAE